VGEPNTQTEKNAKQQANPVAALLTLAITGAGVWYYFGGGLQKQAATEMQRIENQVATDAVAQYQIAKRGGSSMDACVQAWIVAAAYLQAKDEPNYQKWKKIESDECGRAGLRP